MALSRIIAIGNGVTSQFAIPFALGYLKEGDISARVGSEFDGGGNPLYRTITFNSPTLVTISGTPPANGEVVNFTRTVDKSALIVDYEDGDILTYENLNTAQKQALMLIHEALDGRIGPVQQHINMNNYQFTNLGPPTTPGSAVTKAYIDALVIELGAGDMRKSIYDPQGKSADAFARANHTGTQAISTILNLQSTLDSLAAASSVEVVTIAALRAVNQAVTPRVVLTLAGRSGTFHWRAGNYAARVTSDPGQGVYIAHATVATTAGAWVRGFEGAVYDKWFGVVADSVLDTSYQLTSGTEDTTALVNFATFIRGNAPAFQEYRLSTGIRRVWNTLPAHGAILLDIKGVFGIKVVYEAGAGIHTMKPNPTEDSGDIIPIIWHISNTDNLEFVNPQLTVQNRTTGAILRGAAHFDWGWSKPAGNVAFRKIVITGVKQYGGVVGIRVSANGQNFADICTGLVFEGEFFDVYYPCNLQGNGDIAKIKMRCTRCVRAFFIYNVQNIEADLYIDTPAISSGQVNLTCYDTLSTMRNSLSNIRIYAKVVGAYFADPTASLANNTILFPINFIHTDGVAASIDNIRIHMDVILTGNADGAKVIAIHKYDNSGGGAVDTSPRAHRAHNIVWSGTVQGNFGASGIRPFSLFGDNPLGTENWASAQATAVGFENFYAAGATMNLLVEGTPANNQLPVLFIRDSFFGGSSHVLSNSRNKLIIQNSSFVKPSGSYGVAWTATTAPAIGNGSLLGEFDIDGDFCIARITLVVGSTTTFGTGNWEFSLPVAPVNTTLFKLGLCRIFDNGTAIYAGQCMINPTGTTLLGYANASGNSFNSTTPFIWAANDTAQFEIRYRWK